MAGPTSDLRPQIAEALIREAYGYLENREPLTHEITEQAARGMSER